MSIPATNDEMKAWLEANVAPVTVSGNHAKFDKPVWFGKRAATYPLHAGSKSNQMSLNGLFNAVVLHELRFDDIRIGHPEERRISVDRRTLEVTEFPVPSKP